MFVSFRLRQRRAARAPLGALSPGFEKARRQPSRWTDGLRRLVHVTFGPDSAKARSRSYLNRGRPSLRRAGRRDSTVIPPLRRQIGRQIVEHLWSRAGATDGYRWQIDQSRKRLKQADPQPVATHGNLPSFDGKDGGLPPVAVAPSLLERRSISRLLKRDRVPRTRRPAGLEPDTNSYRVDPSARSPRNHRPDPVHQGDHSRGDTTTGAAHVDRGGEPHAGLELTGRSTDSTPPLSARW